MSGAHEILQGVQFLLSKWECNELPADTVLALIEVHLERESSLKLKETQDSIPAEA